MRLETESKWFLSKEAVYFEEPQAKRVNENGTIKLKIMIDDGVVIVRGNGFIAEIYHHSITKQSLGQFSAYCRAVVSDPKEEAAPAWYEQGKNVQFCSCRL